MKTFKKVLSVVVLIALLISCLFSNTYAKTNNVTLTVSAASSLTDVMKEISGLYLKQNPNIQINFNFASSGTLQKQIEQGAPADMFISAGSKQMDALKSEKLIIMSTLKNLVYNDLVLIVNKDANSQIKDFKDLINENVKLIALGEPSSVPAGQYAEEIFKSLDISNKLKNKLVYGKDVREVLTWVEQGNADAGIVYKTDALTSNKVKIVKIAPKETHSPIVYPAAVVSSSKNISEAKNFMKFISSVNAKLIYIKYGFKITQK